MIWKMNRRSVVIGSAGGIAVSALVLLVLPEMTRSAERARALFDLAALRGSLPWFALLGAVLGAAMIGSRSYPFVVAVPAVLLGYGYYVVSPTGYSPLGNWIPDPIVLRFLFSFGSAALILVGVLAALAGWRIRQTYLRQPMSSPEPDGRRHMVAGAAAGTAVAVILLLVLERLRLALFTNAMFDLPGTRRAMLGLFVLGAALGVVIILSERIPSLAVSAAAALTVFVVLHPMLGVFPTEGMLPFLFRHRLGLSPEVVMTAGLLAAPALAQTQTTDPPKSPEEELRIQLEQTRNNAKQLASFSVPMSTEPAFRFQP